MSLTYRDRIQETTVTTGLGAYALGGAIGGYQDFAAVGDGNTTYYCVTDGTRWEVGLGTYSSTGPTLARTTVMHSSLGPGTPITWGAGQKLVFGDLPADVIAQLDAMYHSVGQPNGIATLDSSGHVPVAQLPPLAIIDTASIDLTFGSATLSADLRKQMSIDVDASGVKLLNDQASPGISSYYGTDASGQRGFWKVTSTTAYLWLYAALTSNQAASDPGQGKIKWNTSSQVAATLLYVDSLTKDGIDIDAFIGRLTTGSVLYFQEDNDNTSYQFWQLTAAPTDNSGWWTMPVLFIRAAGNGLTNFVNTKPLIVTVSPPGGRLAAPGGPNQAVQFNNSGAFAGNAGFTFDGFMVHAEGIELSSIPLQPTSGGTGKSGVAPGDLLAGSGPSSNHWDALPIGTDGQVLTVDTAQTLKMKWAAATGGGGSSPTTTKGDLIVRSASADARLPVGTDAQVLVADSAQTLGVRWAAFSGSGGGTPSNEHAFLVHNNGTTIGIPGNTDQPLAFSTVAFDTDTLYNASNGRYTPNSAGKWCFGVRLYFLNAQTGDEIFAKLKLNGATFVAQHSVVMPTTAWLSVAVEQIVDLNGTTDYVQAIGYCNASSGKNISGDATLTYFYGFQIGKAGGSGGAMDQLTGATWVSTDGGAVAGGTSGDTWSVMPCAGRIKSIDVTTAGGTGSCVVDIYKAARTAHFPPVGGDSICGGAPPTISAGTAYHNATLTGFSTNFLQDDVLLFHLTSSSVFTQIAIDVRYG